MADETRSFLPNEVEANRARQQGLGVGQKELDAQRDPNPDEYAVDPQRTEPFDTTLEAGPPANHTPQVLGGRLVEPTEDGEAERASEESGDQRKPWLGEGVPPNVDVHDTGEADDPQNDWGEPADEGALHGANHTRRPDRTEAERGQGPRTRKANKDIISRRM
ncbi:MAG TPA: hypothetical protein VGN89_06160 [Phenylobacterium sp.]|jgi:hypothetical protein|nr:hypothetical protein [Phenylobacterium sp.]